MSVKSDVASDRSESRRDRFVRVAETRTNKIIAMIRLLGNCSGKGAYEYSASDVKKIFGAIQTELEEAKKRFGNTKESGKKAFSLG